MSANDQIVSYKRKLSTCPLQTNPHKHTDIIIDTEHSRSEDHERTEF